jgi:hypothetical protein
VAAAAAGASHNPAATDEGQAFDTPVENKSAPEPVVPSGPATGDQSTAKTFQGTLKTGIMAIGGETTGVVLKTEIGEQYELDFGKNDELAGLAAKLNGKTVVVTGEDTIRAGEEVKERHIIQVATLEEAPGTER